jgi:hypothetical protein
MFQRASPTSTCRSCQTLGPMNPSVLSETAWLQSLNATDRARFLASLSHNLTVAVRVLCHSAGPAERTMEWVRLLNEAHHRVSSYLSHYHVGDEDPGWIGVVVEYVLDPKEPVVLQQAEQAWHYSREAVLRVDVA